MKIAFLVAAHDNPQHFHRLLDALAVPDAATFVHVDAKSPLAPFARGDAVFCRSRVRVHWGDYSVVEATLRLIREALRRPEGYDRLVLLSGADYPIRPLEDLRDHLAAHPEDEFINLVPMPDAEVDKSMSRLEQYAVSHTLPLARQRVLLRRGLVRLGLAPERRDVARALGDRVPYAGSAWWALTAGACRHILDCADREPALLRFYRRSAVPDEGLFHTIVGNSPFAARIRRGLTYTDWTAGGSSPAVLGQAHVERFLTEVPLVADDRYGTGELFFARKFCDASGPLTAQLDAGVVRGA